MNQLFETISGEQLPDAPGNYITNFGSLAFDGDRFLMSGHKKATPTVVQWWLKPFETKFCKSCRRAFDGAGGYCSPDCLDNSIYETQNR